MQVGKMNLRKEKRFKLTDFGAQQKKKMEKNFWNIVTPEFKVTKS